MLDRARILAALLGLTALAGCRGGASAPRGTPSSHPVPGRHSAPPSASSDGGGLVFRHYPLSLTPCLSACETIHQQCMRATPECEVYDRLTDGSFDGGAAAFASQWLQFSEQVNVCARTCVEPNWLCFRRCFDAAENAAPPQRR